MTPVKITENIETTTTTTTATITNTTTNTNNNTTVNNKKMNTPLWKPDRETIENSSMISFMKHINKQFNLSKKPRIIILFLIILDLADYWQLYKWSIDNIEMFWKEIWSFCGIKGEIRTKSTGVPEVILEKYEKMDDFPRWFPERRLNFAQNLLYPAGAIKDTSVAVHFRSEIDELSRSLTWSELRKQVAKLAKILKESFGIRKGDRIAAYAPNCPEVLIYMLAGASIGAIFTSGSPDFGPTAIVDRFSQTKPKVLLSCNAVYYNGKIHNHYEKLDEVVKLCSDSLERIIVLDYIKGHGSDLKSETYLNWDDLMNSGINENPEMFEMFELFEFDTPLYIVYSSGTTGKPKCIVHGAGGSLIQHLKEHLLHGSVKPGDVMMQYTTIGWMMWQWMISGLAAGATLVLYDGSPFRPSPAKMWQLIDELKVTHFGTSAKYLQSLQEINFSPNYNLNSLRVIFSTGSPLPADTFKFVYQKCLPGINFQLASITGGTDILSLFAGGCPILPVHAGEIQVPCLGMALACDQDGKGITTPDLTLKESQCGDLVCIKPFPSQPVSFWLDDPVRRENYRAAYFESPTCPGVWHHGDYLCFCGSTGGLLMLGRSDGTLNPAGVRFGSADLYAICGNEKNSTWISDSLAVGVKLPEWKDEQVFLFLLLKPHQDCTIMESLLNDLRSQIKTQLSPRHVPAHIHPVPAIPHTLNGKKVEVSVKRILNGNFDLEVVNLANPESIQFYREFARNLHEGRLYNNKL